MGRVKLKLKRLENINGRQATYAKQKCGIMKNANELSILCDIDMVFLMFSPTGRPALVEGQHRNFGEVIEKFAQLSYCERMKRKLESLEALKKTFKKLDHDVNIDYFMDSSDFSGLSTQRTVVDSSNQLWELQAQLTGVRRRLSFWSNLNKIDDIGCLNQMEDMLRESIKGILLQKENLAKRPPASTYYRDQPQLPPWFSNNENQHMDMVQPSVKNPLLYGKIVEQKRMFKFLLGLNKDLDEVRGRTMGIKPLPTLREAFSKVQWEKRRRKLMIDR
nr:agamous-like MADS-box protein AGL65 isoform X2 [Ziziphus jujuba var. spinosa]